MPAKIFLVWLLAFCVTLSGKSGQEVGYLDLTTAVVGQRIHQPTTGSGSGMGSGSGDFIGTRPEILQPIRISIVSLGSTKYKVNDEVVYENRIRQGKSEVVVTAPSEGLSQTSSHTLWKMLPYTQPATRYSPLLLQVLGQVGHTQDGDTQTHAKVPR